MQPIHDNVYSNSSLQLSRPINWVLPSKQNSNLWFIVRQTGAMRTERCMFIVVNGRKVYGGATKNSLYTKDIVKGCLKHGAILTS